MDVGTGTTIIASALSSPLSQCSLWVTPTADGHLKRRFTRGWPVLGLGVLRLLAVKYVGYHEQPTEHGTHWNFFLTLFSVWQVGEGAAGVVRRLGWLPLLFSVAALSVGYELCLIFKALGPAILHHPRPEAPSCTSYWNCALEWAAWFVWHNREGIVSVWSHSLLYIIAVRVRVSLFFHNE
jgi:hypothetical protein